MKKIFKKYYKKIALAFSIGAIIVWSLLGTGASLAWFYDTSPTINNIFHFSDFDLEVFHRLEDGTWEKVDNHTKIFDDEALYEPGYVQTVFLKVKNNGTTPFEFFSSVNVNGGVTATNVYGNPFKLQDYLKFGVTTANTEAEMDNSVSTREKAVEIATLPLHNYSTDTAVLEADGTSYIALIVRMPKSVGNNANYRGLPVPKVELGITVKADQIIK